ncbi:DUF3592 domain-containing protein [Streptomyces javensis]|uniref:DUF3592 domain-containing protein n=1 Tax=Streptomyces javensis TaxID=114698 RepID=A0ABS0RLY2_9ACTN|nr:DUF3592 domain-containing protein [Streptomyces javensis]MBI0318470.1 DUF3592 domain-containing protein [Streptomyces javensis]
MAMPGADLLCVAVGLFLYLCALRDARLVRRLRREGFRTEGLVVANVVDRQTRNGNRNPTQTPVVRFHDHQGYEVEFTTAIQGIGLGLATGRRVDVRYLPGESQQARVWMRRHILGPAAGLTLGGTIFLGFGLVIAFS